MALKGQKKKEWQKDWDLKNKARRATYHKKWCAKNPEKRRQIQKRADMKAHYGITLEQYNAMFTEQNGNCLICERNQSEITMDLNVDHNHETGKIRGLLCSNCNTAIGLMKENVETLARAISYLKK